MSPTTNTPPATPKGFVQLPVSNDNQSDQYHNELIAIHAIVRIVPHNLNKTTKLTLSSVSVRPSSTGEFSVNQTIIVNLSLDGVKAEINKQS